ncbi:MAG: rhodanese-like domain-containing protein [Elusimicrobia bacterium]|nr:rhodanese-like domain-containing protein [Elusimicrobiota bacterium]
MSPIRHITSRELETREPKAVLIDVREPGEFSGERMPGSVNLPLSRLETDAVRLPRERPIIVLCRSGRRSEDAAKRLAALGFTDIQVVEGGLQNCAGATEQGPGGVWAMERQVRMAAGALVLLGSTLGWLVHPAFWLVAAGVGAGLVYSAATDTCGMAMLLAKMPWNRGKGC